VFCKAAVRGPARRGKHPGGRGPAASEAGSSERASQLKPKSVRRTERSPQQRMNPLANYQQLARYNTWMNRRVYAHCAELSDVDRRRDAGAFFKSVHGTLNHLLVGDHAWLLRCTGDLERYSPRDSGGSLIRLMGLDQILYEEFSDLRAQRELTDRLLEEWVSSLDPAQLAADVTYRGMKGSYAHPLWWALTHLFNHQTHHRGQVTTLLLQLGRDPGITDFIEFVRGTAGEDGA